MKSLSQKVYQGGRVFLAVGVGDNVFACKIVCFCFPCLLSPCALSKTTSGQKCCKYFVKLRRSRQDAFFFFYYVLLKIDAELFSEWKTWPKNKCCDRKMF